MHEAVLVFATSVAPIIERGGLPFGRGLDIGGRDLNGSAREAFPNTKWDVMNRVKTPAANIVHDACKWDPDFGPYDIVLCTEVFEHVAHWPLIVRNAHRWLNPQGSLVITAAGLGRAVHSGIKQQSQLLPGEHYANLKVDDLRSSMEEAGFTVRICIQNGLDIQAWGVRG